MPWFRGRIVSAGEASSAAACWPQGQLDIKATTTRLRFNRTILINYKSLHRYHFNYTATQTQTRALGALEGDPFVVVELQEVDGGGVARGGDFGSLNSCLRIVERQSSDVGASGYGGAMTVRVWRSTYRHERNRR